MNETCNNFEPLSQTLPEEFGIALLNGEDNLKEKVVTSVS